MPIEKPEDETLVMGPEAMGLVDELVGTVFFVGDDPGFLDPGSQEQPVEPADE